MTKFWMVTMIAILALGSMTGCPDGDDNTCTGEGCICGDGTCNWNEDCASCPSDCSFMCSDAGADADTDNGTDADADAIETEDDAEADTACPTCPNVEGIWDLSYFKDGGSGYQIDVVLTLEQNGRVLTGSDDQPCTYSGTIQEDGSLSFTQDCGSILGWRRSTGRLVNPTRMEGDWVSWEDAHGTFWADRQ